LNLRAEACGRSLQKTNIIKDFAEDLRRGICYLPDSWLREAAYQPLSLSGAPAAWTAMVLGDVLAELREATEYLLSLPYHAAGYRRASLLCLLPAYQTILLAATGRATLFTTEHAVKISKVTMARCIADSQRLCSNNDAIRRYSRRLEGAIREQLQSGPGTSTAIPLSERRGLSAQPSVTSGVEHRV
jgi:farnesyl-diphosphate farnesyltransferase